MMERMWRVGAARAARQRSAEESAPDIVIASGTRLHSKSGDRPEITLSGLALIGDRMYGFSVAHGFGNTEEDVFLIASRRSIGRFLPREQLNQVDTVDLRNYLKFFRVHDGVQCRPLAANGYVTEQDLSADLVTRISTHEIGPSALVVRVGTGAYVRDTKNSDKYCHLLGGILVRPTTTVDEFARPGDSGALVVNQQGQSVGVVVARNDEFVLLAPVAPTFSRFKISLLDHAEAADWNQKELQDQQWQLGSKGRGNYLFTSEAVSEGHPDKVCDRISDEIVDLLYREAKKTAMSPWDVRVACETLATTNRVVIAGEVRAPDTLLKKDKEGKVVKDAQGNPLINPSKFKSAVRKAIRDIGYEQNGFHWKTVKIDVLLHGQSFDIVQGVDNAADRWGEGADDQGIMFGYACRETPDLMPAPVYYSNKILKLLAAARHERKGDAGKLGPDAKSQVTLKYVDGRPLEVTQIVLSTQHLDASWDSRKVRKVVEPYIREALSELKIADNCNWYINPTGKFVIGGPDGDAGSTGRKIIVDTYGGAAPDGGGAFSGRDPSKIDRSAAYAARYLAKNVVAAKLADRCTIQLSYAIGVAQPLSIYVDLHGTGKVEEARLEQALREVMDLSPSGIRKHLDLNKPIYAKTSSYGHFGRKPRQDGSFSWERTDLVSALIRELA